QVCEHLPRMAGLMHQVALVRGVMHQARLHDSAAIPALTGGPLDRPDPALFSPTPQFYPSYGSAPPYLDRARGPAVPFAAPPFRGRWTSRGGLCVSVSVTALVPTPWPSARGAAGGMEPRWVTAGSCVGRTCSWPAASSRRGCPS